MNAFAQLFEALDETTKTNTKVQLMLEYFRSAHDEDKMFAIAILTGNKPKRPFSTTLLREWAAEYAGIPLWLFEESYFVAGDLGETIALVVDRNVDMGNEEDQPLSAVFSLIIALQKMEAAEQQQAIYKEWSRLTGTSLFLFNKMLTGSLRVGVSKKLVIKALAQYLEQDEGAITHRMMGKWNPFSTQFNEMFSASEAAIAHHTPYPFYLAYPLDQSFDDLGHIQDWVLEKKLDGIRGQIIFRNNELFIWSRGEDLLTDKFPEFNILQQYLPNGTVIDGEIIPWKDGQPLPFSVMQTRIGRKNVTPKFLKEAPLVMVCYDLLEFEGKDMRTEPLSVRRAQLIELLANPALQDVLLLSEEMVFPTWEDAKAFKNTARHYNSEGLMLKKRNSIYETGRKRGGWWKWKTDPLSIDAVMIYAQSGHGRRANLFTDYTFAVWDGDVLVPFAKAYSGLTDKEIDQLDRWIKQHTIEKFGPVRSVQAVQVFEIGFEGINKSTRHKLGVALRFPRILRWRQDKTAQDANTKADLLEMLVLYGS
ncbi:DNA ligase-1 [Chitinophaga skermanii]|uniref:DNA ligase (ATP) n=1 Tax=Chitinophaga skermanii TaxID=331697 RepID=A0A327QPG9_9BACT|nr:ATP-dependent DNA ligase [Chitinophaga skermanii]RAJ06479.1 DNA ligase-1 [Chitinophaga skermanii]